MVLQMKSFADRVLEEANFSILNFQEWSSDYFRNTVYYDEYLDDVIADILKDVTDNISGTNSGFFEPDYFPSTYSDCVFNKYDSVGEEKSFTATITNEEDGEEVSLNIIYRLDSEFPISDDIGAYKIIPVRAEIL